MKKTFSKQYMIDNCGCYEQEKITKILNSFKEEITIDQLLDLNIPLKDKYWFLIKKCELEKRQKQQIAIDVAEIALSIFENKYPEDKRPKEAIEAAKQYLAGHISIETLLEKRDAAYAAAAYAAYAAAYAAADAAYAAADVAYAAYDVAAIYAADAAYAAAYAADAAAYAADAIYAADAAGIKQQLEQYLINFINNN